MFIKSLFVLLFSTSMMFSVQPEDPWAVLIKQCNQEKFYVRFPEDPVFEFEDGRYHFYHQSGEVEHHLEIDKREEKEKEKIFQEVMERLERSKEIAVESITQNKDSLELVLSSSEDNTKTMQNTIVSDQNIFTFRTESSVLKSNQHTQFVQSFSLIS